MSLSSSHHLQTNSQNSQILNEARLKVLQARQSYVNRVLEEALENLVKAAQDEEMYKKVLQKLIEQVTAAGDQFYCSRTLELIQSILLSNRVSIS